MKDIKAVISKNLTELRQKAGMTQLELAERLNYSDKAVSKWERGESLPDISVLLEISNIYGVTLDGLVREEAAPAPQKKRDFAHRYNRGFITGISVLLVWLIAMFCFVLISLIAPQVRFQWLAFLCAVPVSCIVWLVFNSAWFDVRVNYLIVSLLMWSALASLHISFLALGINIWLIYLLGIPGQIIILMWSGIKRRGKKKELPPAASSEK